MHQHRVASGQVFGVSRGESFRLGRTTRSCANGFRASAARWAYVAVPTGGLLGAAGRCRGGVITGAQPSGCEARMGTEFVSKIKLDGGR